MAGSAQKIFSRPMEGSAGDSDQLLPLAPHGNLTRAIKILRRFRRRLSDPHFWYIQAGFALITALHVATELPGIAEHLRPVQASAVTLYFIPVAYASLRYGWEGGLASGVWASALASPNILLWHRSDYTWGPDVLKLGVVVLVGMIIAWKVEVELDLRRRAEEAGRELTVSEAEYRNLFESAADAILVLDARGAILSANPAAATLTGYLVDELKGMASDRLVQDGSLTRSTIPSTPGTGGPREHDRSLPVLRRKDGNTVFVDVAATALPQGSDNRSIQVIVRNVTAQRTRELDLRALLHQVTRAQEEERKRIARELHDDTAQTIAILRRELDETLRAEHTTPPDVTSRLVRARDLAAQTLTSIRRFSHDLRPPMLDDLGLAAALDALLMEFTQREGISTRFEGKGEAGRLNDEAEFTLYRIAQEAIRNAQKHAASTEILVTLEFREGDVRLSIVDDGIGFEPRPLHARDATERGGLGLIGMHERAALLAARLDIDSAPGRGTRVVVTYPCGD